MIKMGSIHKPEIPNVRKWDLECALIFAALASSPSTKWVRSGDVRRPVVLPLLGERAGLRAEVGRSQWNSIQSPPSAPRVVASKTVKYRLTVKHPSHHYSSNFTSIVIPNRTRPVSNGRKLSLASDPMTIIKRWIKHMTQNAVSGHSWKQSKDRQSQRKSRAAGKNDRKTAGNFHRRERKRLGFFSFSVVFAISMVN